MDFSEKIKILQDEIGMSLDRLTKEDIGHVLLYHKQLSDVAIKWCGSNDPIYLDAFIESLFKKINIENKNEYLNDDKM